VKILAAENSTPEGSLAWLVDGELAAACSWSNRTRRNQAFFMALESFLDEHAILPGDVDAMAVGRGPGNFSGMRTCQAAIQGLALPNRTPVLAISSGVALAWQALEGRETGHRVAVVGDARRGALWYGLFSQREGRPICELDWRTIDAGAHADMLSDHVNTQVLSSECERVRPLVRAMEIGSAFPSADWLARLAAEQLAGRREPEPLGPIYLHPAVAPPA
jgi:tRNA threonylcarbamoyladenosine biosynthesis protein TsaB